MLRISKPESNTQLFAHFFGDVNITINIADKFESIRVRNRKTRRGVGNPYVWYIYIGYEPDVNEKDYEATEIYNVILGVGKSKSYTFNGIRCNMFAIKPYIYADKEKQTIWVAAPGATLDDLKQIAGYVKDPYIFEEKILLQTLKPILGTILKSEKDRASNRYNELRNRIASLRLELTDCTTEMVLVESQKSQLENLTGDAIAMFTSQLQGLNKDPNVQLAILTHDGKLKVKTNPIPCYGKNYGTIRIPPVTIVVDIITKEYYYINPEEVYKGYSTSEEKLFFHPHAIYNTNGKITCCWGNAKADIEIALNNNELFTVVQLLIEFLNFYNADDPAGRTAKNWPQYDTTK